MTKDLIRHIVHILIVLISVSFLTFILGRIAPGDPAETLLAMEGADATEEELLEAREYLGLDKPIIIQYGNWIKDAACGDFGISYKTGLPVLEEVSKRLPATIELAITSLIVLIVIAIPLGIISGLEDNRISGKLIGIIIMIIISTPLFCIGIILIQVFGVELRLLPVMGRGTFKQLILPSLTLGIGMSASFIRLIRSQIIEEKEKDYVKASLAYGVPYYKILTNGILRGISIPIINRLGITFGALLGGVVIVENIFAWPGLGMYLVEAITARDYPVIQCYTVIMALIYIGVNCIIDCICTCLDPRTSIGGQL